MAIYNIFDYYEKEVCEKVSSGHDQTSSFYLNTENDAKDQNYIKPPAEETQKSRFFSAICARFFFFLLLIADLFWGLYTLSLTSLKMALYLLTLGQVPTLKQSISKGLINLRRAMICFIALFIAIFSPALGIMFSCMYFLMYDKSGIEEVVPASLREQFQSIFAMNKEM